jgi:hypothetical protein
MRMARAAWSHASNGVPRAMAAVPLPDALLAWCQGQDPTLALDLLTCGEDGWPHLAHLSWGDVVIDGRGQIRLALWAASRGAGNLAARGQACLVFAAPAGVFELRLRVVGRLALPPAPGEPALRGFCLAPVAMRDKSAPYASITSALRFGLHAPQAAQARWARVRQALLTAAVADQAHD